MNRVVTVILAVSFISLYGSQESPVRNKIPALKHLATERLKQEMKRLQEEVLSLTCKQSSPSTWNDEEDNTLEALKPLIAQMRVINDGLKMSYRGCFSQNKDTFPIYSAGRTPLDCALSKGQDRVAAYLRECGSKTIEEQRRLDNLLIHALQFLMAGYKPSNTDINRIIKAINNGANINLRGSDGCTPLHFVARRDQPEIAALLLQNGAEVNAQDVAGTPLHVAVGWGEKEIIQLLIDEGADVNARSPEKKTPLFLAVKRLEASKMQILLNNGADIDVQDEWKWTPLALAIIEQLPHSIKFLLENGANPEEVHPDILAATTDEIRQLLNQYRRPSQ